MSGQGKPEITDAIRRLGQAIERSDDGHPTDDDLFAYLDGTLRESDRESLSEHLLWCRNCTDRVAGLERLSYEAEPTGPLPMPVDEAWRDLQARAAPSRLDTSRSVLSRLGPWIGLAASLILTVGWAVTLDQLRTARAMNADLTRPRAGVSLVNSALPGGNRGGEKERTLATFDSELHGVVLVLTPEEPWMDGRYVGRMLYEDGSLFDDLGEIPITSSGTFTLGLLGHSTPAGRYWVHIEKIGGNSGHAERFPIEVIHSHTSEASQKRFGANR